MDCLKFHTAVNSYQPVEGEDGSGEVLTVYTITRQDVQYQTVVNLKECQKPKPFLIEEACKEIIIDKCSELSYKYDEEKDLINCKIHLMKNNYIELNLTRVNSKLDAEREIAKLKAKIDELEPYEIIHEHVYPTWNSLEEFMKLPGFKYFEAAENDAKYYKSDEVLTQHRTTLDGTYYIGIYQGKYKYGFARDSLGPFNMGGARYIIEYDKRPDIHYKYGSSHEKIEDNPASIQDRDLLETISDVYKDKQYRHFPRSVKGIAVNAAQINGYVYHYIQKYVYGWILLNHELVVPRHFYYTINVRNNQCFIKIYRSKKLYAFRIPMVYKSGSDGTVNAMYFNKCTSLVINEHELIMPIYMKTTNSQDF